MSFRVRLADAGDTPEVLALLAEHLPGADPRARHAWLYEHNPGGRALTWVVEEEITGALAGLTSMFPFRLWHRGREVRGALGGDGYVRPAFRRRGLGAMLHDASRRAMRAHGIRCMYGAPGPMNVTPLKNAGSREIGTVTRWMRPLRGRVLGAHRLDAVVTSLLRPWRAGAALDPVQRDDPRVDRVWAATRDSLQLAAIRDAGFYTWRFVDAPAQRQHAFVIEHRGQPIAACALERLARGVRIVDLVAPPAAWPAALRAIAAHAAQLDADLVDIKLMDADGRRRHLWRSGLIEREGKPYLVMVPNLDDASEMLDAGRWFYSGADSDLDFLE
jgi:GNAT superfamily N-acetyltransferase